MTEKIERKKLLYLKHTWMDVFRLPLILTGILIAWATPFLIWIGIKENLLYLISLPMIGVYVFLFLFIPGITAIALWIWETHKDEEMWIEGDCLVYKHGKDSIKVKMEDILKIYLGYNKASRAIYFYLKRKYGKHKGFIFGENIVFRQWITPEELERKGIEIWNIVRRYNPEVKLWRLSPKMKYKYMECWNGREWEIMDWCEVRREIIGRP